MKENIAHFGYTFCGGSKAKFKNFILRLKFVDGVIQEAYKSGGVASFPLAQKDILETMRDDIDKQAEELAKKKLNDILSPIDMNAIASITQQGVIYIGGTHPDDGRLTNLKAEAEFLMQSDIWQLLQETPKMLAEKAMFVSGEGLDDLKKGRSILYTLASQKKIVDLLKSYQPKPKAQPVAPVVENI
jgi:hypothetical protein